MRAVDLGRKPFTMLDTNPSATPEPVMPHRPDRREWLKLASVGCMGLAVGAEAGAGQTARRGVVAGHPEGAQAGLEVLAAGGNAVDAVVTAALVAGVTSLHMC